jgi:FixJ family two-component response regulator
MVQPFASALRKRFADLCRQINGNDFAAGVLDFAVRLGNLRQMECVATVHVVEDSALVRVALSRLLSFAGYRVKAYESAEAFLAETPPGDDTPSVLLTDLVLPGLDGIALAEKLGHTSAPPPVVFLTAYGGVPATVRAMKEGAVDFLEKPVQERELLDALDRAVARSRERILERQRLADVRDRYATLTGREREVLALVVSGLLNKQIGSELGISEKTVKVHRARVVEKMGAQSLPDLVRMAGRLGIPVESRSIRRTR